MKQTFLQYLIEDQKKKGGYILEYHKTLNPRIWTADKKLQPKVRKALQNIAKEFTEFLKADGYKTVDLYFTGSLANYNYTSKSDIDLHIVLDYDDQAEDCEECCGLDLHDIFDTKKTLWNEQHDITIYDYPVELYVQDAKEPHIATGIYSVQDNKWVREPKHKGELIKDVNTYAVATKVREYKKLIDKVLADKVDDYDSISKITDKIKTMRQSGLEKAGEFSVENLAFKKLRSDGYIDKLMTYKARIRDDKLTLEHHQL